MVVIKKENYDYILIIPNERIYINAKKHIPNKNEKQLTDIPYDTIN